MNLIFKHCFQDCDVNMNLIQKHDQRKRHLFLDMNTDTVGKGFTDKDIMDHVKNNRDEMTGFVDTLTFFKG